MRRPLLRSGLVLCLLLSACQPPAYRSPVVGVYWDLVATGTVSRLSPQARINGHAKYSFHFTLDSVYHYLAFL